MRESGIIISHGFRNHYFKDARKSGMINVMFDPVKSAGLVSVEIKTKAVGMQHVDENNHFGW